MEKYGFVYIWFDKKHKRYYVGCHWGKENDGYICSSSNMKSAYKRRPEDFKRKVTARIYTNKHDLLEEEYRWLSKIKNEELGKKYYNLHNHHFGHWSTKNVEEKIPVIEKMRQANKGRKFSEEHKRKIGNASKGIPRTQEVKQKISQTLKGKSFSEEHKINLRISGKGKHSGEQNGNYGRQFSEEHKLKLSQARKKRVISEETKRKISESMKKVVPKSGHVLSEEHKQNISKGMIKAKERSKIKCQQ